MTAALLGFLVVFALAFLRVPLAVAMTIAGLGGLGLMRGWQPAFASTSQVIFETGKLGIRVAWDGTFEGQEAAAGTYAYKVQYDAIQSSCCKKRFVRSGSFNLVR